MQSTLEGALALQTLTYPCYGFSHLEWHLSCFQASVVDGSLHSTVLAAGGADQHGGHLTALPHP